MKKKKLIFIFFVTVIMLSAFSIITFGSSDETPGKDELDDIENMIIINSMEFPEEDESTGEIIYRDSFDDSIEISDLPESRYSKPGIIKPERSDNRDHKEEYIKKLRRKDKAWHYTEHKIKKGENLWEISEKYDIDHKMIIKANNIKNPDMVRVGNTLSIPNRKGIYYKIINQTKACRNKLTPPVKY